MSTAVEPGPLRDLLDRAAVADLVHSVARAMDERDWELFSACYAPDAQGDYVAASADGRDEILASTRGFLGSLDVTQHLVGNVQVVVDGDTASSHATFIAQHVRAAAGGEGQYLLGGTYDDEFRRTDEGWRISRRQIRGLWGQGDPAVLTVPVS